MTECLCHCAIECDSVEAMLECGQGARRSTMPAAGFLRTPETVLQDQWHVVLQHLAK